MRQMRRLFAYAWPAPYTCVGLAMGMVVIALGGAGRLRGGILEFSGGALGQWIGRGRIPFGAITVGHAVLGLDQALLDGVRSHEHVHVRQYERWGLLFVPAYLMASALAWMCGGHFYQDNVFERDAFARTGR